jgi:hypothetical protein
MNAPAAGTRPAGVLARSPTLASAAYWLAPLLCLAIYWRGLQVWFQADDFVWLGLRSQVHDWHTLMRVLFAPMAQGSTRPLSERAFFLVFESQFGMHALPFHVCAFLTQCANLTLVAVITRRLTGSPAAGFWAAILWMLHGSLALDMVWISAYNQILCGFFLLSAFWFLLRYLETGRRSYNIGQWVMFVLGFGALEINVVYPALAALYTYLYARKSFRTILPLCVPSAIFVALDRMAAAKLHTGIYALHWTSAMVRTFLHYCYQAFATTEIAHWIQGGPDIVLACLLAIPLLAFAAVRVRQKDRFPLFSLGWFVIVLAPVLPLRDHVSVYYLSLPTIGLAMLGGYGLAAAAHSRAIWKAVAALSAAAYLIVMIPADWLGVEWWRDRSMAVERLVLGVVRARQLHPHETILLDGVDSSLFWVGVFHHPFTTFAVFNVFLTPGSEERIEPHPELGRIADYVLPDEPTIRGLNQRQIVVYRPGPARLQAITGLYFDTAAENLNPKPPKRVEVGNPLMAYLLGPEWYALEGTSRWMPRRATLRIGAPDSPSEKLYLSGYCSESQLRAGPLPVRVTAGGVALAEFAITNLNEFRVNLALPSRLVGTKWLELSVEAGRTFQAKGDGRKLGLSFGTFEIRD